VTRYKSKNLNNGNMFFKTYTLVSKVATHASSLAGVTNDTAFEIKAANVSVAAGSDLGIVASVRANLFCRRSSRCSRGDGEDGYDVVELHFDEKRIVEDR
jgi:hypothetical protein